MAEKTGISYEGIAKRVWNTDNPNQLIIEYKDDVEAYNGTKRGTIQDKGVVNNKVTNHLFKYLENNGVQTHFIKEINHREVLVRKAEMIPLEVIVRNIAAGNLCKRLGVPEGTMLPCTVIEYNYKNKELGSPMINEYHAFTLHLCSAKELEIIAYNAFKVNKLLRDNLKKVNLDLVDLKLEFGRTRGRIILADEISPDTCRLWDTETGEKLDRDRFRHDLGNIEEGYKEIAKRLLSIEI